MESRTGSFAQGLGHGPTLTAGLMASSASQNAYNPKGFRANGLNQPLSLSTGNGNSAADATRQTPNGQLPSMNGSSPDTYSRINPQYGIGLNI